MDLTSKPWHRIVGIMRTLPPDQREAFALGVVCVCVELYIDHPGVAVIDQFTAALRERP